jgi:hypothetical protein
MRTQPRPDEHRPPGARPWALAATAPPSRSARIPRLCQPRLRRPASAAGPRAGAHATAPERAARAQAGAEARGVVRAQARPADAARTRSAAGAAPAAIPAGSRAICRPVHARSASAPWGTASGRGLERALHSLRRWLWALPAKGMRCGTPVCKHCGQVALSHQSDCSATLAAGGPVLDRCAWRVRRLSDSDCLRRRPLPASPTDVTSSPFEFECSACSLFSSRLLPARPPRASTRRSLEMELNDAPSRLRKSSLVRMLAPHPPVSSGCRKPASSPSPRRPRANLLPSARATGRSSKPGNGADCGVTATDWSIFSKPPARRSLCSSIATANPHPPRAPSPVRPPAMTRMSLCE